MVASVHHYAIPIKSRGPKSRFQFLHGIVFLAVFAFGCCMVNGTQILFLLPLRLLPNQRAREIYENGVRYTKGSFGMLITLMNQLFAPTSIRVTFETEGIGKFSKEEIQDIVVRDSSGSIVELRFPKKMVIISNHQMYADWWYIWCLTYLMDMHRDVLIVLKKSLKYLPILGWGMQVFRFIFLTRSWASDKHYLISKLAKVGNKAQQEHTPLAFIIFPEGTLVSVDTRPISKKYADKIGVPDMNHALLPRSTGLHYALRALSPRVPNLKLLDITIAYPGIPPMGFGQSYYTLRSIFLDRVPPPVVHMHLRLLNVATEVPIGDLSSTNPAVIPPSRSNSATSGAKLTQPKAQEQAPESESSNKPASANGHTEPRKPAVEADVPEDERIAFDEWVRELWRVKDAKLEEFYHSVPAVPQETKDVSNGNGFGSEHVLDEDRKRFSSGAEAVQLPLRLKSVREALDAFCLFGPAAAAWTWAKLRG